VGNRKIVFALGLGLLATQAFAASQQDWDGCQSQNPERVIPTCTRIIPDETEPSQSRADAYVFRAGAYLAQGNIDRAIADYSEAIKLTPRNVVAYLSRATARFHNGDREQAILDYAIAEKLDAAAVAQMASSNSNLSEVAAAEHAAPPPPSALAFVDRLPTAETLAAPQPAPSPANPNLIPQAPVTIAGVWNGTYYYPDGRRPVPFTFRFDSSQCSGRSEETNTFGDRNTPKLFANLKCEISVLTPGEKITILKTYDGTGGVSHSVVYTGTVSADLTQISGYWTIKKAHGNFTIWR
jgi:hypothetical protein